MVIDACNKQLRKAKEAWVACACASSANWVSVLSGKQFSPGSYLWQGEIFLELNQIKSDPFMLLRMNRSYIYWCRAQNTSSASRHPPRNLVLFKASSRCHCGSWMRRSFPSMLLFHLNFNIKKMSPWCSLLLGIASVTVFILKQRCTLRSRVSSADRWGRINLVTTLLHK